MANQLSFEKKEVILSQIVEDLRSGLTKWRKDDIGFGSLEKKYNLLPREAIDLFSHPKIKNVETRIPTFIIIDDIEDLEETIKEVNNVEENIERISAKLEIGEDAPVQETRIEKPRKKIEAFI